MKEEKRCDSQLIPGLSKTEEHQKGKSWEEFKFPDLEHLRVTPLAKTREEFWDKKGVVERALVLNLVIVKSREAADDQTLTGGRS